MTYHFVPGHEMNLTKLKGEISETVGIDPVSIWIEGPDLYIDFASELSAQDQVDLEYVIQNHEAESNLEYVTQSIINAMTFGQRIIAEFGAENVILGFTTTQTLAVASKYSAIIGLLNTGSLKTALMIIEATPPDANVSADRIKKYANKIRTYLGMPLLP